LKRISLVAVANYYGRYDDLKDCIGSIETAGPGEAAQMNLRMEKPSKKQPAKPKNPVQTQSAFQSLRNKKNALVCFCSIPPTT